MMRILLYCLPIIYRDNMYIIAYDKPRKTRDLWEPSYYDEEE